MPPPLLDALLSARVYDLEQPRFTGMPIHPPHPPRYLYAPHPPHPATQHPPPHRPPHHPPRRPPPPPPPPPAYFSPLHRRHRDTYHPDAHGPRSSASGVLTMMEHTGTHIDALCHQAHHLKMFGGVETDEAESPAGFARLGIETV